MKEERGWWISLEWEMMEKKEGEETVSLIHSLCNFSWSMFHLLLLVVSYFVQYLLIRFFSVLLMFLTLTLFLRKEEKWRTTLISNSLHSLDAWHEPGFPSDPWKRKKKMERKRLLWQQTWHGKYEISFTRSLKMKKMEGRRKAKKEGEAQVIFHLH